MPTNTQTFNGKFLVAMPSQAGSDFESSLIYIFDHSPTEGAFGIIINHAIEMTEGEVIENLHEGIDASKYDAPAFNGGPVDTQRGFIIHPPQDGQRWDGQVDFSKDLAVTTSSDILKALATTDIPHYLIALGYSGWDAGQLEQEINDNAWLVVDADPISIFSQPWHQRLSSCLANMGIRYEQLSAVAGHA
ncbi:MAG: YqgE/AlgH family protein [Sinobacterium sp.]|nr:YqgE/AlgH family protein [Sinobacterium sp.]